MHGWDGLNWFSMFPRTAVKCFAGRSVRFAVSSEHAVNSVRLTVFPDGGANRMRCYARPTKSDIDRAVISYMNGINA